ncbi:hypothetical protein [Fusobacterium polymorphum]|jgi:hypothetical protein|uniref:hypothetical protein n=1 Tax=Fusobacterium nucleatum subsp. polymorphum TaxID=76857 RepID=UPI002B4C00AF|nr:hypothetical protein [Fusobacterium polymorphum]WRL74476.1 hypothetical protein VKN80_07585 [Fusobacterium polymorphum]
MEEFKTLSLGKIKEKITSTQDLYLVSVDYDNKDGIKLEKNINLSNLDTILEEVKNFYKLYIFNEDFMLTVFNFGNNEYRYSKVKKSDFDSETIKYVYMREYGRLKVRIGKIGEREVIQYIKFGGEN